MATLDEKERRARENRRNAETQEIKDEFERQAIDERNEQWMKDRSVQLTKIMEEKRSKYGNGLEHDRTKDPSNRYESSSNNRFFDPSNLVDILVMKEGDERKNYLHYTGEAGDFYYSPRYCGKYSFKQLEATEQNGLWFIQNVECFIAYSSPLSNKYWNQFQKEWKSEYSPRFFLAEETCHTSTRSPVFLYDNGKEVVPMEIAQDKESFTMYTPSGAEIKLPSQTKTGQTIHDCFYDIAVDSGHGFLDRKTRITVSSEYVYKDLVVRDAKDTVLSEGQYLDLSFESARDYIFRQEVANAKDVNSAVRKTDNTKPILCIVVRPRSQSKATLLSAELKQKISQLKI